MLHTALQNTICDSPTNMTSKYSTSDFQWHDLLITIWLMCGTLFLHISTSLGCFCPRTIFTKKRIGQVTSDLPYTRFTYYTKDNQQGCSRLSNGFSLRCLRPWMNYLPPVWWSTFRFRFLIWNWYESLIWRRGIVPLIFCLHSGFVHWPSFDYHFHLKLIYSQMAFFILSTFYWNFP